MKKTKEITQFVFLLLALLFSRIGIASPQMPDYLVYKGDTIVTYNLILEIYLKKLDSLKAEELFGLAFRDGAGLNCWRGYQSIYKIDNDSLFLQDIIECGELFGGKIDKKRSIERMRSIFGERLKEGNVYIDWFSGILNFPTSEESLRWDGVFYRIFEKETIFKISEGKILSTEEVKNYIDDPKGINRIDKKTASKALFKKVKKIRFRNKEDFDCSERYLINIDKTGRVSNVRMTYSEEELIEYFDEEEYNFCISKLMNALKSLEFDLILDKGKPIAEDIYLEIWIEEYWLWWKVVNWTDY